MPDPRKPISKRLRFEVFKRDSFKCQYCGAEAPIVVLHVDHIRPVADGGSNDLTNLITSCSTCNLGKGASTLDDHVALNKVRAQMDELQERREQLELMMQWREGLRDLDEVAVERLTQYWEKHAPGWSVNDSGKRSMKKWLHTYSVAEVCVAMDTAATQYLKFDEDKTVTEDSWDVAFHKIPGICRVRRASVSDPDLKQLFYIRGILRNRIPGYFDEPKALQYLKNARSWEVPLDRLTEIALAVKNWSQFLDALGEEIRLREEELGENEAGA